MHEDTTLITVAAVAENNAIAHNGQLPWETLPEDEAHYEALVKGNPIIVGRRTYEDIVQYMTPIAEESPIAVLTANHDYTVEYDQHTTVHDKIDALNWIQTHDTVYNLGGGSVYELFLSETDKLVLSHIPVEPDADTFFPEINHDQWRILDTEPYENFTVKTYQRIEQTQQTE